MTRLRRSELSTPGHSEKMIQKAAASAADFVFLDLEDSVPPSQKEEARRTVVSALKDLDWGRKTRAVRINSGDTTYAHEDVIEVATRAGDALDTLIIPKVKAPRDVWWVETLLDQLEAKLGRDRPVGIEVLIEEAEGLVNVDDIARSTPRLEALIFGPGDMSASQGVRAHAIGKWDTWLYARSRIVVSARAAGIDAIDGPFANFRDLDGYREEASRSAGIGFVGKWAIHPDQISVANEIYSPTEQEVSTARKVIESFRDAGSAGMGGVMVDAATVRIMEAVLRRAELVARDGSQPKTGTA